ncbi:conserved hypothetical protein [Xenorhabdus nematophila F1]|uniref:Uncharacterized protein n=1 Tax=Xenorhabdus nematophila (strain ATCC 19061 / DSM 3370 / CCUG 14189 / LMG 1036 / NCIMB 9965 / AN6) TaxID=406817 RepID=D3VFG9_XENNA|nr:hypothetical protein XNC1_2224 [Xenorhabdus nematophila ATCC 19061]CCW32279.1 conserved hypothetical protein [Xenorhabdus nematophila F1]CEE94394.1 hypothetical protein XNA1_4620006 [Xenorhabdus nematophila str. Anatoliense]CEF32734.1 hypothetical protein XNW1_4490006 [Xenorhabdus nematophila str. Websteri]CEK23144.1 hypothetical protein XNC2_2150 [Xenorhabdus nematophila AN6/1]
MIHNNVQHVINIFNAQGERIFYEAEDNDHRYRDALINLDHCCACG